MTWNYLLASRVTWSLIGKANRNQFISADKHLTHATGNTQRPPSAYEQRSCRLHSNNTRTQSNVAKQSFGQNMCQMQLETTQCKYATAISQTQHKTYTWTTYSCHDLHMMYEDARPCVRQPDADPYACQPASVCNSSVHTQPRRRTQTHNLRQTNTEQNKRHMKSHKPCLVTVAALMGCSDGSSLTMYLLHNLATLHWYRRCHVHSLVGLAICNGHVEHHQPRSTNSQVHTWIFKRWH